MKLTLQQKVALVMSILWVAVSVIILIEVFMEMPDRIVATIVGGLTPPVFILWISGALKPLVNWFRGSAS